MDHGYGQGRYTLVASADGLPANRSISLTVEVSAPREKRRHSRFQFFGFTEDHLPVGGGGLIVLPFTEPPGVTLFDFDLQCVPSIDILEPVDFEVSPPDYFGFRFITTAPGTCTLFLFGEDANGEFTETATLTIG